jgi:hypothetical protein
MGREMKVVRIPNALRLTAGLVCRFVEDGLSAKSEIPSI